MTHQEQMLSKANVYVMPAIDDYLATRCLLLNSIFVGLTLAHEAVEKLMKGLLILEGVKIPKSCHEVNTLSELLIKKDKTKYKFLNKNKDFIKHLDQNYAWRYYDGDVKKRSKKRGISELNPIDKLWIALYDRYIEFIPDKYKPGNYLAGYLFAPDIQKFANWSEILKTDNRALEKKTDWQDSFIRWYSGK